jgi:phage gpG-like protein
MMYFQITSTADRFTREINSLALGIRTGTRDLLESAVDEVARPSIAANFQAGGRPPWDKLADSTLERRERAGLGSRPLIATGRGMAAALDRDRWAITRTEASYPGGGWPAVGGWRRFHQEGAEDGHFPARPIVRHQPEAERALDRVGLAWLDGNLRRAGF